MYTPDFRLARTLQVKATNDPPDATRLDSTALDSCRTYWPRITLTVVHIPSLRIYAQDLPQVDLGGYDPNAFGPGRGAYLFNLPHEFVSFDSYLGVDKGRYAAAVRSLRSELRKYGGLRHLNAAGTREAVLWMPN